LNEGECYASVLCQDMASLHKQPGKPHWFCAFTDSKGKRCFRSTLTANKKEAEKICTAWAQAAEKGRKGLLNADQAREIISRTVADIFAGANADDLPMSTVKEWCEHWLQVKSLEVSESSLTRYSGTVESFLDFYGARVGRNIAAVQSVEIVKWRDQTAKRLSPASVNIMLKILRVCFGEALRQGITTTNPAAMVRIIRRQGETRRRELTVAEIKKLLALADQEWQGLILFGLYTGQRLGDLVRLTWQQISTEKGEVAIVTQKTGRRQVLPLASPLMDYVASLPPTEKMDAPLFPNAFETVSTQGRVSTLSNQFRGLLVDAGLALPVSHQRSRAGRASRRETSEISFHSLRHSAVTFLKSAGVSDALAREIIGHESAAVSRVYTHLSVDDARKAISRLPDVTNG